MTDTYTMDDSRTHMAHIHVSRRFALSLLNTYSSRPVPVPVPIPVLHRYRYSSQALCATLFFFRNCSSAVAVAVQWQWARSPQCSAQCCVLRAACSACCKGQRHRSWSKWARGALQTVLLLDRHGADRHVISADGTTALMLACMKNNGDVVEWLLDKEISEQILPQ